jgi:hypothetical protein
MGRKPLGKTAMTGHERNLRWLNKKYGNVTDEIKDSNVNDEMIKAFEARIAELEKENVRLRAKTDDYPRTPEEWAARKLEVEQREAALRKVKREAKRAAAAGETMPDEKSKEEYERQIRGLNTKLQNERIKHKAYVAQMEAQGKAALTKAQYRLLLNCLHPDRFTNASRDELTKAMALFNGLGLDPAKRERKS